MISKLAYTLNNKEMKRRGRKKPREQLLYDLTMKYQELYEEIENILSGKKGTFRNVFSGRCNFSARSVIIPNASLRIDEVILPYSCVVELMQQVIVNVLQKSYNISYAAAYDIWSAAQYVRDERVVRIIKALIKDSGRGIPILINRRVAA